MKNGLLPLMALLLALAISRPVQANLVTNGSFETADFSGWTINGDPLYMGIADSTGYDSPTDGLYQAFFGPVVGENGVSQVLTTTPGATYQFSFDLATFDLDGQSYYRVLVNGTEVFFGYAQVFDYTPFETTFVGTGSDEIAFSFYNRPAFGILDNVQVNEVGAVPEPSSVVLLGVGAIGVAVATRRRKS